MVAFAGALLSTNLVNNFLAPNYNYVYSGQSYSSAVGTATWPSTPTSLWFDGPGQLSVDVPVGDGRAFLIGWGFEGYNNSTASSSIRMGINLLRGTSSVQASDVNLSAMTSNSGAGLTGAHHASRWHVFTGLVPGDTLTVKMQAYQSSASGTVFVDNQWLFVSQFWA